jgi:low temperature requirement protein LtrA
VTETAPAPTVEQGKRVSWVELYFDLVFVLAVAQVAHVIVAEPHFPRVAAALGLFMVLWWTWIGFATLYNRHGREDSLRQRVLIVVGAVPCGVAAVAVEGVPEGHVAPRDPAAALDTPHFAERFGLFMVILLGEVVASTGSGLLGEPEHALADWLALATGIVLAGALWWLHFDSAAEINARLLEMSGGSPGLARAIFGIGQSIPAFALLLIAAGAGMLVDGDAPHAAYRLLAFGLGIYLAGTRCASSS